MKYSIIFIIVVALLSSCERAKLPDQPNYLTSPIEPFDSTDIMFTPVDTSSVAADGKATKEILLQITDSLFQKAKIASFTISPIGTFADGSTTMPSADIDVNGQVRVYVKSSIPGLAYVKATVNQLTRTSVIKFYETPDSYPKDTLVLTLQGNGARADNYTAIEILARIKDPQLFAKSKKVTFTTAKGTFADGSKSYTISAGADSVARAYLKHDMVEQVIVTATLDGTYTEHITLQFTVSMPLQLFVEPSASTIPPLYTSNMAITAKLLRNPGTVSQGQTVTFKDSSIKGVNAIGAFLNTTLSDAGGLVNTTYWIQDTSFRGDLYIIGEAQGENGTIRNMNKVYVTN